MREIEIKVRVDTAGDVVKSLKAAGVELSEPKEQHDVVYCLPEHLDGIDMPDTNWLRIRTENGTKVYLTLKRSVTGSLDSIEHETEVSNGEELATILAYLGYEVFSDLTKVRRTGHVEGGLELCLDEIPSLGSFVELEKLCADDADLAAVEQELLETLERLGITYGERVTLGYDELMNEYLADNG